MQNPHENFLNKHKELNLDIKAGAFLTICSVAMLAVAKQYPSITGVVDGFSMGVFGLAFYKNLIELKPKHEEYKKIAVEKYQSLKKDVKLGSFALIGATAMVHVGYVANIMTSKSLPALYLGLGFLAIAQFRNRLSINSLEPKEDRILNTNKVEVVNNIADLRNIYKKDSENNKINSFNS